MTDRSDGVVVMDGSTTAMQAEIERLRGELERARGEVVFFAERLEKQDHQYSAAHPQAAIYRAKREALEGAIATEARSHDAARADLARERERVTRLEAALRRARGVIADMIKAEDERSEAVSKCIDGGLIERDCADDCPQDDTCDCPGTVLIGQAINRRNFHEDDCLRAIDAALSPAAREEK